jgi:hypothetical protein
MKVVHWGGCMQQAPPGYSCPPPPLHTLKRPNAYGASWPQGSCDGLGGELPAFALRGSGPGTHPSNSRPVANAVAWGRAVDAFAGASA